MCIEERRKKGSAAWIGDIKTRTLLNFLLLVACYYCFSVGLTFFQKWFIKDFKFPLTVVACHYVLKFLGAAFVRKIGGHCNKCTNKTALNWREFFRVLPIGVAASVDIGLSNWALEYITVSLYTMAKSSCIIFILLFAVLLSLEKLRWSLVAIVLLIAGGLFLFTFRSTQFDFTGFLLVELAAALAGVRWTVSQLLMHRKDMGLEHPVDMVYHTQPWMVLSILPLSFTFEGVSLATSAKAFDYRDIHLPLFIFLLILVGGLVALCMEISEYYLLAYTSSITLYVCGIIKEIFTLILAHYYNGDVFTGINLAGLTMCLCGIVLHVVNKIKSENAKPDHRSGNLVEGVQLLSLSDVDE